MKHPPSLSYGRSQPSKTASGQAIWAKPDSQENPTIRYAQTTRLDMLVSAWIRNKKTARTNLTASMDWDQYLFRLQGKAGASLLSRF
jgi:hypothetical protein